MELTARGRSTDSAAWPNVHDVEEIGHDEDDEYAYPLPNGESRIGEKIEIKGNNKYKLQLFDSN